MKNLILIASFLFFFILSYLVVLYAYGYFFDFRNLTWVKTGGFLAKTGSSDVSVYINGRLGGKTSFLTASFIEKNLLPGDYSLRFEKNGFSPIAKNIEIKSGEAARLIHIYMINQQEIKDFISSLDSETELPFFISKKDGLLYKKTDSGPLEKISSEPVYIKNFNLKIFGGDIYLASYDIQAPGVFELNREGNWKQIYELSSGDLLLSPDKKKLAIVGQDAINVLWLRDDDEPPYFKKDHKEPVLKISEAIEKVFWFKTGWHLVYLTESGKTYFVEVDGTGGRNEVRI